jgi:hypothetical protein
MKSSSENNSSPEPLMVIEGKMEGSDEYMINKINRLYESVENLRKLNYEYETSHKNSNDLPFDEEIIRLHNYSTTYSNYKDETSTLPVYITEKEKTLIKEILEKYKNETMKALGIWHVLDNKIHHYKKIS